MSPESPGNLIALDLEWNNSRLECQVDRYDSGDAFLYVSWNAIECPEHYVPVSGGAAFVWVPEGYTHRKYRARVYDVDNGFEWRDVAQGLSGAMLILTLPLNYVLVSPSKDVFDQSPVDLKSTEDGRIACYWWLQPGRFAVRWQMENRQSTDIEAECREARRKRPPAVSPVHIDRPPEVMNVPSNQPSIINRPPEWHVNIQLGETHMGDKINIGGDAIGAVVGSHASLKAHDISAYKQVVDQSLVLDDDLKRALKNAREALEREGLPDADKRDAADDLGKLTDELQKPEKDVSRVRRLWNHIKDIAPPVASILSSAASLAKMLGGG
jgi:hypothetical protein